MTNEEAREIILNTAFIGRSQEEIDTAIEMAAKALEQEPKAGHWIEHEQYGILHIECSECSTWFLKANLIRNSFCPNCGADMREVVE